MAKDRGVAVVTGASSGIGRATAFYLAGKGFEVFAGVRKKSDADSIRAEAKQEGANVTPLTIDVTKPRSIATAKAAVQRKARGKGVKGLVNNAGVGVGGPVEFLPLDDLRHQLEVNVIGHVAVTQAFLPLIRKAQGRIVNMTSVGGRVAHPFMSPYHVSKYGMEAITESMRVELQPWGIWVAAVEPGNIDTRIWEKSDHEVKQKRAGLPPAGKKLYRESFDAMDKVIADSDGAGNPPEKVAKKVFHALTSRRPKPRYLVGGDARGVLTAKAVLPARAFDRMRTRIMKLPKRDSALS